MYLQPRWEVATFCCKGFTSCARSWHSSYTVWMFYSFIFILPPMCPLRPPTPHLFHLLKHPVVLCIFFSLSQIPSTRVHFLLFCADAFQLWVSWFVSCLSFWIHTWHPLMCSLCLILNNLYCWLVKHKMLPLPSCLVCHGVRSSSQPWHIYTHKKS